MSIFVFTDTVSAQEGNLGGFVVQPGRIDVRVRPRQNFTHELRIHNFDPNDDISIDLDVIELTQNDNGDWLPFDTDPCSTFDFHKGLDLSKVSSCRSWIKMEEKTVVVPADGDVIIPIRIDVPYNARTGFYGATIMTTTSAKASQSEKVPMFVRTGIPVITSVELVPNMPSKVAIKDIGMEFIASEDLGPGQVLLSMKVKNDGTTFPRLKPIIRLRGFINNHWQLITTHEFDESGIIPGKELVLKSYLEKTLPSAKYELDGLLYVDNQLRGRDTRMAKEIQFKGDPLKDDVDPDVPLDLETREIILSMAPGLRRIANIKVHAAVSEKINVVPIAEVPKSFKGKVDGTTKVESALSCAKWISFKPEKLTLEGFRTRNISISVEMPEDALKYPNYYAAIGLKVLYPDGQEAGTTWVNLCVQNENANAESNIGCSSINLEELNASRSEYLIHAGYKNIGTSHIIPQKVRAAVVKAEGYGYTSALLSTDKPGMFIPYETRHYTGILDFSSLEPDDYNLEVLMDYPPSKQLRRQVRVRVRKARDGRRIPEILNEEVKELIPVKWY